MEIKTGGRGVAGIGRKKQLGTHPAYIWWVGWTGTESVRRGLLPELMVWRGRKKALQI